MPARRNRFLFEHGLVVSAAALRKAGVLAPRCLSALITSWTPGGSKLTALASSQIDPSGCGAIQISIFECSPMGSVNRPLWSGEVQVVGKPLSWTTTRVSWLICPVTNHLCRTLYFPPQAETLAGYRYWPRNKYAHASENRSRFRRAVDQSRKLRSRLEAKSDWLQPIPQRGARQSPATYCRLLAEIDATEMRVLPALTALLDKLDRARML
jgi:hypothetical protein